MNRRWRRLFLGVVLYSAFCAIGGIYLADGALRPSRRLLTEDEVATIRQSARSAGVGMEDHAIAGADGITLRAWTMRPTKNNGDAVILLHGLGDNRAGMLGYAQLLMTHGFTVLLPDARGHGASEGALATYGLLERDDIRAWIQFLAAHEHPRCVFGFGESMGASQLLQSLGPGVSFCAVAAESPFANFREIAYDRMGQPFHLGPWVGSTLLRPLVEVAFLRARWKYGLDMQQISPEESAAATKIPVLLIHGQVDGNIPVRHSRRIHAKAPSTSLWEVPGADHCGAVSVAPQEFEMRVVQWFATHDHAD